MSQREAQLESVTSSSLSAAAGGGGSGDDGSSGGDSALRVIELGCSQFLHSELEPHALAAAAECVAAVVVTQLNQDFFRLRGGLRVLSESSATQNCVSTVVASSSTGVFFTLACENSFFDQK
jgi:hypothetical protein